MKLKLIIDFFSMPRWMCLCFFLFFVCFLCFLCFCVYLSCLFFLFLFLFLFLIFLLGAVCMSSICPPCVCLSVRLSVCVYTKQNKASIHPSIYLSIHMCSIQYPLNIPRYNCPTPTTCLPVYLSTCLPVYLSTYLPACLPNTTIYITLHTSMFYLRKKKYIYIYTLPTYLHTYLPTSPPLCAPHSLRAPLRAPRHRVVSIL